METRSAGRRSTTRILLGALLGLAVMGAMPWPAAAADPSPDPSASASPSASPTPTSTPTPTATPTAAPTATPTPQPTATPTPRPTATPTPRPTATPIPTPTPTTRPTPRPTPVITKVNLYRASAMVRQYTNYWCVPAATQSMVNLIKGTSNRTYRTQKFFYKRTREHNRYRYETLGNDPQGWAWTLRTYSGQPYKAYAFSDKTAALNKIVESIARTNEPVGVTVRGGTHAWVVLGYRTSHDPIEPTKKTILGFYVSGPLGTTSDRWPYGYVTLATFKQYFTRYHEWQRSVIWEGRWVVIGQ